MEWGHRACLLQHCSNGTYVPLVLQLIVTCQCVVLGARDGSQLVCLLFSQLPGDVLSRVTACCFSFDGVFVFTGDTSGDMCAWDTRTGGLVARTSADDLGVNCLRAAPSNLQLGKGVGHLRRWEGRVKGEVGVCVSVLLHLHTGVVQGVRRIGAVWLSLVATTLR